MKYIITENKLKWFIQSTFGVDLTDKIRMVEYVDDLPRPFKIIMSILALNKLLNHYGPMFIIECDDKEFLIQFQGNKTMVLDSTVGYSNESSVFDCIGLPHLVTLYDLVTTYLKEEN